MKLNYFNFGKIIRDLYLYDSKIKISFILIFLLITPALAFANTINWDPGTVHQVIGNGQGPTQDYSIKFTSKKALSDISVWVVPELRPFIRVSPEILPDIQPNTEYTLNIQFRIPPYSLEGIYDGTIHLRSNNRTIAMPLPVIIELDFGGISISQNTHVLPEPTLQNLSYISEDATIIEFDTISPDLTNLSPDDILIFGITNFTPNGLLCKIEDVFILNNKVRLLTSPASLTEAIEEASIDLSMDLTPENLSSFITSRSGVSMLSAPMESVEGFYVEISAVVFDEDGDHNTSSDQIKAKGHIEIDPSFDFHLYIDDWSLEELTFVNTIEEEANIEFKASISILDYDEKIELFRQNFNPVTVWAGWVPIVFAPVLTVNIGFDGEISVGITSEVTQTATFSAGLSYDSAGWGTISNLDIGLDFEPLNPAAECNFKGYTGPQLNLLIYGLVGPYAETVGYLELESDLFDTPPWELYAGLEVGVGVRVEALSHEIVDYYVPGVIGYRRLLAQGVGQGTINGIVKDAVTSGGLSGVFIQVFDGASLITSAFSEQDGTFSIPIPAGVNYRLEFEKNGYLEENYYNVEVAAGTTVYLETVLQIDENHSGAGNISGRTVNALNGVGVPGLNIVLREGINVRSGSTIDETTTGTNGFYSFTNISAGNYTAEISGSQYNTAYYTVICIGGTTNENQNFTVSPILPPGETRIILTWGLNPRDLDSHLTGPLPDGTRFHMFYPYKGSNSPWPEYVNLDLDDVTSYGPETTTILQQIEGVYRFSVHDYTNRYSSSSNSLSNSAAQVRVYRNNEFMATFNVPPNQGGTLWTVFELSGDTITPINLLTYQSSPVGVQSVQRVDAPLIETDAFLLEQLPEK